MKMCLYLFINGRVRKFIGQKLIIKFLYVSPCSTMDWTTLLLTLFLISTHTSALDLEIFKVGKQYIYTYHAKIKTGTLLPAQAYSQWDLYASLKIIKTDNFTFLQLGDLKTGLYNGPRDGSNTEFKNIFNNLPKDAETYLTLPFIIPNLKSGGVLNNGGVLAVKEFDPLWSVNIKRAVVSALQLNLDVINKKAALVTENGLHGYCSTVEYSTVSNIDYVYVRKVIDRARCLLKSLEWSSAPKFLCATVNSEDAYSASTTREYTLGRKNKTLELRHINSNSRLYVQPFNAASEAQHVYQYQEYRLNDTSEAKDFEIGSDFINKTIQYEFDIYDLTHGRAKMDQIKALTQSKILLEKLVGALDHNGLGRDAGREHSRVLTQLYYKAFILDLDSLRQLYRDIGIGTSYHLETTRNMFLELLPQIGTKDSVHFLKELILNGTVKDLTALKLLAVFPFYVRQHSKELLTDMSILMDLSDNFDSNLRHTAILSFATFVYQTYISGGISQEILDFYARKYYEFFTQSQSYEKKMLYLQGLDNIQLGSTFDYLKTIVENDNQNRHLRFLGVWASMLSAPFRSENIFEIYWPILVNRTQHLEMRVAAFTMLLVAQPTKARLLTLFWYFQGEPDPHLYRFFYTTLISLQKTTFPCYQALGQLAKHVTRFIRKPSNNHQWSTGNYLLDYQNSQSSFGGMAQLFLVADPRSNSPNVVYLQFSNYANARTLNQAAFYMKIHGLPHHLKELLSKKNVDSENNASRYAKELLETLQNSGIEMQTPDDLHLEFITKVQGKTIFCQYINKNNMKELGKFASIFNLLLENHLNNQIIFLPYLSEYAIPSDMGTLLLRGIVSNSVASVRGNSTSDSSNLSELNEDSQFSINLDMDLRYYTYTTNFLESYNPIFNFWHGTSESRSVQARILFNGTMISEWEESVLLISGGKKISPVISDDYLSAVMHSHTATYILGENTTTALEKYCSNCTKRYVVHKDLDTLDNQSDLFSIPLQPFGTKIHSKIFDCESFEPQSKLLLDVYSSHRSNSEILPIADVLLYGFHLMDYITYIMPHGSCGVSFHIKPFYDEPTELQLRGKYVSDTSTDAYTTVTLSHKKLPDGPVLQIWNASMNLHLNEEDSSYNLTIKHTDINGDKQMMCLNMEMIEPHRLSLKPTNSVLAHINSFWSPNGGYNGCPDNGSNINNVITSVISDKQKLLEENSEDWPYKQCREKNHNKTAIPCYLTAKTGMKDYTLETKFKNMPKWLQDITQRIRSLFGVANESEMSKNEMGMKFIVSDHDPNVILKIDEKNINLNTYPFKFINHLQYLVHNDWDTDLGFHKQCVVSSTTIWTSDNLTISLKDHQNLKSKKIPLWAECLEKDKLFGVFLDKLMTDNSDLAVTMYAGNDIVTVRLTDSKVLVTVNDSPLTDQKVREVNSFQVWRYSDQLVIVNIKKNSIVYDSFTMRYTRDYVFMELKGNMFESGRLCGLCAYNLINYHV